MDKFLVAGFNGRHELGGIPAHVRNKILIPGLALTDQGEGLLPFRRQLCRTQLFRDNADQLDAL
jgi:hypothetical protein